jgi:hypothetical protein
MKNILELQQSFNDHIFDKSKKKILSVLPYNSSEALERLQIYRNNVLGNVREVLSSIYPVIKKILGEKKFKKLAHEYAKKFPSKSGNLDDFGKKLPQFVSRMKPAYLKELAQFELLVHETYFVRAIEEKFDLEKFKKIPQEKFPNLVFFLDPSCVFFTSKFAIFSIWKKEKNLKDFLKKESAVIFSGGAEGLNDVELQFLSLVKKKKKFYEIYETLCKKFKKEIDVGKIMNRFIENGVIVDYA